MDMSIDAVHDAILAAMRGQFPDLATIADYRDLAHAFESMPIPALLVELTDIEWAGSEADDGTGRVPTDLIWDITIIMGLRTAEVGRALRAFSAALAVFVHGHRWGLKDVDPAVFIMAGPHEFSPALQQYHAWRVEMRQRAYLGVDVWKNEGSVPEALFSWAPEIGPDYVDSYQPIVPLL